jgi:hypothetical protein
VKTTLEIPDTTFRKAKARAAQLGIPLREFITRAVEEKLSAREALTERPWMKFAGALADIRPETRRIARIIEEEFGQIEPEDRA